MTKGFGRENEIEASYDDQYPVWSDDGNSIAGVDRYWSNGFTFPSLQGWKEDFNPRFVVFLQDAVDGERQHLVTVKHHCISLFYMKTAGYVLINYLIGKNRATLLMSLDGDVRDTTFLSRKTLIYEDSTAIPSRDGSNNDNGSCTTKLRVNFVDAQLLTAIKEEPTAITVNAKSYEDESGVRRQWPFFFWTADLILRITDSQTFSLSTSVNGTVVEDRVIPSCASYPTASGPVNQDALRVTVEGGMIVTMSTSNLTAYCGVNQTNPN